MNKVSTFFSNPLVMVLSIIIIIIIILAIFKAIAPNVTLGLDVNAHIGALKGNFELEAFNDSYEYFKNKDDEDSDSDSDSDSDNEDDNDDKNRRSNKGKIENSDDKPSFIMYYVDWCGHCKRTKPEFEKLIDNYKGKIQLKMIDAEDPSNKNLVMNQDVKGFPTIRYYKNGLNEGNHEEYNNDRTEIMFKQYLISKEK
jgi:thiol-disulfide isomerase/thioredoxin